MPQMSPLNWITLLFMFLLCYLMVNMLNYFIFIPSINKYNGKFMINKNMKIWKW